MKSDVGRLCLGTAQFGSHYGATNTIGKPSEQEVRAIFQCSYEAGIRFVDTAASYGGPFPYEIPHTFGPDCNVIVKVKATDIDLADHFAYVSPWAILSHEPEAEHLVRAIRAAGCASKIGQSIYWEDGWPDSWAEVVQFPFSLADRRFVALANHVKPGFVKFARSVFLQGKLLEMGYSIADCLGYVLRQPVDYAIVGVNSVRELEQILSAAEALPETIPDIPAPKMTADELDPRTWGKTNGEPRSIRP